ncbi:MAG: type III pantothenate kinase [Steroidobacteraceae bacterium]
MSTLLIDIGNTRVKWARDAAGGLGRSRAARHAGWSVRDFEPIIGSGARTERILVASVAGEPINTAVRRAAQRRGAPVPQFVATQRKACGVTAAYLEPWRLGVDRFLGMIGARAHFERLPLCVVGVGTAMTVDLLGADGRHRGGAIIPAPPLMISSLLEGTRGIRRRAQGGVKGSAAALFARSTRSALEQGARYAAAATVDRAVQEAHALVGRAPLVVLTGGGADELRPLIRSASIEVADLVLWGLAVWAREG